MRNSLFSKIRYILNRKQKISLIFLFFGILINSFLELISISTVLPIINMLVDKSSEQNWYVVLIKKIFHTEGNETIFVICIIMMIIYLLKSAYVIFINYRMKSFMRKFQINLSSRLIRSYLYMPYEFHLQNNSAALLRSATTDVTNFNSMMTAFLQIFLKIIVSVSILIYLFINNVIITSITVGVLGSVLLVITFVFKPKIRKIGQETHKLNALNIRSINQAFNGIKESKIADAEEYFVESYKKTQSEINELTLRNTLYNEIPNTTLESFGMIALLSSLLVVMNMGIDKAEIVSMFTLFALSTIKLLPCLSNISSQFSTLFVTKASVDLVYNDIKKAEQSREVVLNSYKDYSRLTFNNELVAKNVSFKYNEGNANVLTDVSAVVKKGEFVAFSGVSGAGKTTFIDLLLGLLKPTSGNIYCDDTDISTNPRGWHENLSYIPQMIYLMDDTVRNNIAFGIYAENVDDNKIWQALEKAQLANFIKTLPKGLDTIVGERGVRLSGGQRQRIGIARALYRNTQVLIFDEATSALDYDTESAIINCVKGLKREHTIIMITHRLNTIESCDHIYEIVNGKMSLKR